MVNFKGAHFAKDMILFGVRRYVAYPLSDRHVEELMQERGVSVDHATINRWVVKYSPQLKAYLFNKMGCNYDVSQEAPRLRTLARSTMRSARDGI